MKSFGNLLWLLLPLLPLRAADKSAIQSALLDDRVISTVPVSSNRVTTISFPGPISAIDGAGVTTDPKMAGQIQLAHAREPPAVSRRVDGHVEPPSRAKAIHSLTCKASEARRFPGKLLK